MGEAAVEQRGKGDAAQPGDLTRQDAQPVERAVEQQPVDDLDQPHDSDDDQQGKQQALRLRADGLKVGVLSVCHSR